MTQRRRKGKLHRRPLSRYYMREAMPLVLCGACLTVVLEKSEQARGIYREIVESYRLPDIEAAFRRLESALPPRKVIGMLKDSMEALRIRRSEQNTESSLLHPDADLVVDLNDKACAYSYVFEQWFNLEREEILSPDFRRWHELMNKLIRVGFNRKSDRDEGIHKVTGEQSQFLFFAIHMRAFAEYRGVGVVDNDEMMAAVKGRRVHDVTTFMRPRPTTRRYRRWTESYGRAGYRRKQDRIIERGAEWWYQCSVVYSSPAEFWKNEWTERNKLPDWSNVGKAIKPYDEAVGYARRE
jgi:hypothetical protein